MAALEGSPHPVLPLAKLLLLSMILYDIEYPLGQFGSVILPVSPPNFLCTTSLLAGDLEWEKENLEAVQAVQQ